MVRYRTKADKFMEAVWKTDWLASKPVFYNEATGKVSHNINDVIEFQNVAFHAEGLVNYLEWGYSTFGQTPIKNVKFLPPNTMIHLAETGKLRIESLPDPLDKYLDFHISEADIIELIREKIGNWTKKIKGKITLPLSGGYDSRLLAYLLPDKSNIQAFTYGLSSKQEESFEIIYARHLCQKLTIDWQQIELGYYHNFFDLWNKLFGISTHAHGMYQIEFYKKIIQAPNFTGNYLLSGIIGDAWAGSFSVDFINTEKELIKLAYHHGMHANPSASKLKCNFNLRDDYFQKFKIRLKDPRFRIIEAMRHKMILLSYLLRVPEYLGFDTYSPFLDVSVAMAMLNLPNDRRLNRTWQTEFFRKVGLGNNQLVLQTPTKKNTLNYKAVQKIKPKQLDGNALQQIIDSDYVRWINNSFNHYGNFEDLLWKITGLPKINRGFKLLNIMDRRKSAYYAYLTIKPLDYLLKSGKV